MSKVFVVSKFDEELNETQVVMAFSDEQMAISYCKAQNAPVHATENAKAFYSQKRYPFSYDSVDCL